MSPLIVIADDFTGAAEIAAIAADYGLTVQIAREPVKDTTAEAIVYDTDTRSSDPQSVATRVAQFVTAIQRPAFKKIDSVLRGPVCAEAESLLTALGLRRCLIVAQNPAKGRAIVDGRYQIDRVDLSHTHFASDPQHPAKSSDVLHLLGSAGSFPLKYAAPGEVLPPDGIIVGGGSTPADVRCWADAIDAQTLPIGGAEFFAAMLESRGLRHRPASPPANPSGSILCVCGSASHASMNARRGIESSIVLYMPDDYAVALEQWTVEIIRCLELRKRAIVTTPHRPHASPLLIARRFAHIISSVLYQSRPDCLIVEGGETASSICTRMAWTRFSVHGQFASGVVLLKRSEPDSPDLIVKPGSYPWPPSLWKSITGRDGI